MPTPVDVPTAEGCPLSADAADTSSSDSESEFLHPDFPLRLREKGKEEFSRGQYEAALICWTQSLKESLKRSVRNPSVALYRNQLTCRLNMAMAYLKLERWVDAKEQAELVLEQRAHNIKALCRLATAFENLQEWDRCRSVMLQLSQEARRAQRIEAGEAEQQVAAADETTTQSKGEDDAQPEELDAETRLERLREDMGGLSVSAIKAFLSQMEARLKQAEAAYKQRARKVFGGIGSRLEEVNIASDRTPMHLDGGGGIASGPKGGQVADPKLLSGECPLVVWKHRGEGSNHAGVAGEHNTQEVAARGKSDLTCPESVGGKPNILSSFAVPVVKTAVDDEESFVDDFNSKLWKGVHDARSLKEDKRALVLSLPFTLLRILELLVRLPKRRAHQNEETATSPSLLTASQACDGFVGTSEKADEDEDPLSSVKADVRQEILRACSVDRELTIHVLGARGDIEMESQWTAALKRLPTVKILRIVFIGFNDKDDKWSKPLAEGVMSPPLAKTQGLSDGRKLVCFLFKGLYQLFLKTYPTVLTDKAHAFFPALVMIPEPNLARFFDSWIPAFLTLFAPRPVGRLPVPVAFTGHSLIDRETHDAANLPHTVRALGARWILPIQSNPYAVRVKPESDWPPMKLYGPKGSEVEETRQMSGKNAVLGCAIAGAAGDDATISAAGAHESDLNAYVRKMKSQLSELCDVSSETDMAEASASLGT